jgi:hypothetical protein
MRSMLDARGQGRALYHILLCIGPHIRDVLPLIVSIRSVLSASSIDQERIAHLG